MTDSKTGYTYIYNYDSVGRLNTSTVKDSSGKTLLQTRQVYNANDQLTAQQWIIDGTTYSQTFSYSRRKGDLISMTPGNGDTLSLTYDTLQRLSKVDSSLLDRYYTYRDISSTQTTGQVSSYQYKIGSGNALYSYGYTYDELGNIATYTENGVTYEYTYDVQNQLLSQSGGGKTYAYTYDGAGNILTASDGTTTHTYKYGYDDADRNDAEDNVWKDLLLQFDGQPISYDASGNPESYYNGTRWNFTWEEGRRLVSANGDGKNLTFTYDSEGVRLAKTVDGVTHNYLYASGKLLRETWGNNTLDFFYDESGHPYAVTYTTSEGSNTYYYVTNLQGDVLHLLDSSKQVVASYTYDPYGKVLTATGTLAEINPLRYRGYYYDQETGLYYLQSRYYDPTTCRFINADALASTGQGILGCNMFAYCNNSPVNYKDPNGQELVTISAAGIVYIVLYAAGAVALTYCIIKVLWGITGLIADLIQTVRAQISYSQKEAEETEETLPNQGLVEGDPEAPPVDAGKQGKHVPGHNNYDEGKSSWPKGQNGVSQTQEAWQNGEPDPKVPGGNVRIGTASDGTVVRVHIDGKGAIHGYPLFQ